MAKGKNVLEKETVSKKEERETRISSSDKEFLKLQKEKRRAKNFWQIGNMEHSLPFDPLGD